MLLALCAGLRVKSYYCIAVNKFTGMSLKKLFSIVTLSGSLSFLAGLAPVWASGPPVFLQQQAAPVSAMEEQADALSAPDPKAGQLDVLPDVSLTSDLLFMLLTAEIAYQRNDWMRAYTIMMSVAKETRDPRLARRAAEMAANARQPTYALESIRFWRELAPQSEEAARYMLGFILLSDDLSEAKPIFAMRLKKAPAHERGLMIFQIQRLLAGLRNQEQAFALLEELVEPYQKMLQAHMALSQGALRKGDRARAIKEARQAIAIKPDSSMAVLMLAQAIGKPDEVEKVLSEFIARNPRSKEVRVALGRILITQKKYALARREFEALLAEEPDDQMALYSLGLLTAQLSEHKNAEKYLTAYMKGLRPGSGNEHDILHALLLLAQLADERGDEKAALDWLEQIESRPGRGGAYLSARIKRAKIMARQGRLDEARQLLADTQVKDTMLQVQRLLAESHLLRDAGRHHDALQVLDVGRKEFPDDTRVLYDYAMLAERLDRLTEMETALRRVIVLEPKNYHAYNALGYSLVDRNLRLQEARELLERALELAPEDAFVLDSMGWWHFRRGELAAAEKFLRRAYEKLPDAEMAAHLGEVLWMQGRKEEARQFWRLASSKEPGNKILQETLKRLNVDL